STGSAIIHPRNYFLPILTLTAVNIASFSRYMRSSALDNLAQDYIRLARAKGLSQRRVLYRHLLRNACLPMITLVGLSIPDLLAGNLLVEVLFNIQGLGLLFFNVLQNGDSTGAGKAPAGRGKRVRRTRGTPRNGRARIRRVWAEHGRGPDGARGWLFRRFDREGDRDAVRRGGRPIRACDRRHHDALR